MTGSSTKYKPNREGKSNFLFSLLKDIHRKVINPINMNN